MCISPSNLWQWWTRTDHLFIVGCVGKIGCWWLGVGPRLKHKIVVYFPHSFSNPVDLCPSTSHKTLDNLMNYFEKDGWYLLHRVLEQELCSSTPNYVSLFRLFHWPHGKIDILKGKWGKREGIGDDDVWFWWPSFDVRWFGGHWAWFWCKVVHYSRRQPLQITKSSYWGLQDTLYRRTYTGGNWSRRVGVLWVVCRSVGVAGVAMGVAGYLQHRYEV